MLRMIFSSLLCVVISAAPAWAQEVARPDPEASNLASWALLTAIIGLVGLVFYVLLMLYAIKRQKSNRAIVARMQQLAEERNELARQQIALQAETNRLLERLIAEGISDRPET